MMMKGRGEDVQKKKKMLHKENRSVDRNEGMDVSKELRREEKDP